MTCLVTLIESNTLGNILFSPTRHQCQVHHKIQKFAINANTTCMGEVAAQSRYTNGFEVTKYFPAKLFCCEITERFQMCLKNLYRNDTQETSVYLTIH